MGSGDTASADAGAANSGDAVNAGTQINNTDIYSDDETATDAQPAADADAGNATASTDTAAPQADDSSTAAIADAKDQELNSLGGRDFAGQVTKTINGKTYILIGNEQQLRAIGSGKKVTRPVWEITQKYQGTGVIKGDWVDVEGSKTEIYAGDADLSATSKLNEGSSEKSDELGVIVPGSTRKRYVTLDDNGNEVKADSNATSSTLTYSADANYIIFRNIDVSSDAASGTSSNATWTPLMFSGTMLGDVAPAPDTAGNLWSGIGTDGTSTNDTAQRPVISNVSVHQTGTINPQDQQGIGFFATIGSKTEISGSSLQNGTAATVANLKLKNVSVTNESTKAKVPTTLLGTLTGVVGTLLELLTKLLGIELHLDKLLSLYEDNPSNLATGAFAGRIYGKVTVTDCAVEDATVSNVASMTGGFAGYVEGSTDYALKGVDTLINILTKILNLIPFVGLGDLVNWLLSSTLMLNKLIPTAYHNPVLSGCDVTDFKSGTVIGAAGKSYAGGFVGAQIGAIIENSTVTSQNAFTVTGSDYVGGFAGVSRNGIVGGLIESLGVELLSLLRPQSLIEGSTVSAPVTVEAERYAGGFIGAMASAYAVNDTVAGATSVHASTSHAGGFTGYASVGWGLELGTDDTSNTNLIKSLGSSVKSLLEGGWLTSNNAGDLLSLAGVKNSDVLGCQVEVASVASDGDYAAGLVAQGSGTVIAPSSADNLGKLSFWRNNNPRAVPVERKTALSGFSTVSAAGSFAGGIAGSLRPATVAALLNDTLGVGDLKGLKDEDAITMFTVDQVTLAGAADKGLAVTAGKLYAGGAIAFATGGNVTKTAITDVASVTAGSDAGGFIGASGPGEAVGASGIDLLGLIKLSGLLSVAQYSSVNVASSTVTGAKAGMTVTATGKNVDSTSYVAGGFFGEANSTQATDAHVYALKSVTAPNEQGVAGGFVGESSTGGLVDTLDDAENTNILQLVSVDNLLGAVPYLVPNYRNATTRFVNGGGVTGDTAGGFAGDFQSGKVNIFSEDDLKEADFAAAKTAAEDSPWGVINIDYVAGGMYAGGWGGKVTSGALATAGAGGLQVLGGLKKLGLNISAAQLLSAVQAYVPLINRSGVKSDAETVAADTSGAQPTDAANLGLVVSASRLDDTASHSGSAGGYIGYGSGVQVSHSDVTQLRHTTVTEPAKLEGVDGSSYFNDDQSAYAVTAPRYAGGYIGHMDVGSAASVGDGLSLLGTSLQLTDVLGVVRAVVSTIEHSDVNGGTGGFAVRASSGATGSEIGDAGGFAGLVSGGHIQDSNSYNFSYVIGQISSGGYAGQIEPGDVARVLGELNTGKDNESALAKLLHGLVSTNGALASLVQDFVPTVRNSETTSVPCGGAVRAQAASDASVQRGMAGGYVGHNLGGRIWGNNNAPWTSAAAWESQKDDNNHYTGTRRDAMAERIRSVYGAEMAGGFTGYMEPADTAKTGSVSLLFGLVKANNILGALQVAYPTEENTQVTGPVRGISLDTWNSWSQHVASKGYYGGDFYRETFTTEDELAAFLADYVYGTNVVAGRSSYENRANAMHGGVAGGYVGLMRGGTTTNGQALDTKTVSAMRAAGGFAGRMETGGAVELGSVSVLGLNLNAGQLLNVAQVLVPVVKSSGVQGFRTGMTVKATGTDLTHELGFAGGYVGYASGAQLWGDAAFSDADQTDDRWSSGATHAGYTATGDNVTNLRRVSGTNCVGGYAGLLTAGGVADVNTNASSGLLQDILNKIIETPSDLLQVLNATVTTVRGAHVSAVTVDSSLANVSAGAAKANADAAAWGFTVDGSYKDGDTTKYARAAGGFAGSMRAVVAGTKDRAEGEGNTVTNALTVSGLRGVEGGQYAGGFFGQADIESVASVGGSTESDQSTKLLLNILKLGNVSALDAFRTYVYHGSVAGVADGFQVRAQDSSTQGMLDSERFTGVAGGFGGALINGSVKNCAVTNLSAVAGINYTGGFIGHLGKAGTVDADKVGTVSNLLGATAGVLDIWGSHVEDSSVAGIAAGYTVISAHGGTDYAPGTDGAEGREVAGGFAGYADLARVKGCTATNLKKVASGEVAGGFAGETKRAYLVDAEVSSALVDGLLKVVDALLKILYIGDLENLGVINLGEWFGIGKIFDLKVLADGELLYVNLFGLKIGVSLDQKSKDDPNQTDVAKITIGDSVISLPVSNGSVDTEGNRANLKVALIKGNRTRVEDSTVTGIAVGYDVFGGGASQGADGTNGLSTGYAGGFVGLNDEGVLANDHMVLADTIRGTSDLVDPFAYTKLKSVWYFNSMSDIVGEKDGNYNSYKIYRSKNESLTDAFTSNSKNGAASANFAMRDENADGTGMDAFTVSLFKPVGASGKSSVNTYDGTVPTGEASGDADTTWLGIKGAVRQNADGSQKQELRAYETAAKAVLMRDTAVTDNAGGITPEPGEGQDPCDTYADLTVAKVWNDLADKDGKRPDSVTFKVTATYTDAKGELVTPDAIVRRNADGTTGEVANPITVTLSSKDAATWSDTWRTVVDGLPVAFTETQDDGTTVTRYYTYTVTEPDVPAGYTAQVGATANDFTTTVTNTHRSPLPNTGGRGIWLFLMIGAAVGCAGAYEAWRRRRAGQLAVVGVPAAGATVTARQPRPVGGHFRDGGAR